MTKFYGFEDYGIPVGHVRGRGKHDANVVKTSKTNLKAKARHAKAVKAAAKAKARGKK